MNEALLLALFDIGSKAYAEIQRIRAADPEAYERVSKHVVDSLERAKAEALKP